MAAPLSLTILSLLLFFSLSSSSPSSQSQTHNTIHQVCKASRDPPTCEAWLSNSGHVRSNATVLQVVQSAVEFASYNIAKARSKVQDILSFPAGNQNHINAAKNCLNSLHYSEYRINLVSHALPRGDLKDARAWMSAALGYLYDCWSALNYVDNTSPMVETMSLLNSTLIGGSSNALGIIANYDFYGEKTAAWGAVKTERDGFWEHVSSSYRSVVGGSVPAGLKADVSVCKSGKCHYKTVQAAVNAALVRTGSGRFVIRIKAGVYEEMVRVPLEKKNIVFIGDGMGKTVITGSTNVGQYGVSTYNSATVGVLGDGFMAKDLTIKNTAGPNAHQAVAFVSDSDKSIIENCEFIGNQDTLYAHSLRQYYKSCRIQGNIDFIFGNSAAFFDNCLILVAPHQINPEKGEKNTVTAHGRIDPAQSTGFVFHNCVINGTEAYMSLYYSNPKVHKTYLGRPWKQYSRTVFIRCTMEALIMADGWLPWDGDFALKTLYYGEFGNRGKGANTSNRVSWSNRIPGQHVDSYSVQNFIQGDQWITI